MHTWSLRCLQTPWMLRACCFRSSRSCGSCILKSCARGYKGCPLCEHVCAGCKHKRAFFTAAKHNETTQMCQKSEIYTIATMVGPESHTRGGSSCYGARERSTSQRAGAPFQYAEGFQKLVHVLLSYLSVVGRLIRFDSIRDSCLLINIGARRDPCLYRARRPLRFRS